MVKCWQSNRNVELLFKILTNRQNLSVELCCELCILSGSSHGLKPLWLRPTCNTRFELWSIFLHSGIFCVLHHYHVSTAACPRHPLTPHSSLVTMVISGLAVQNENTLPHSTYKWYKDILEYLCCSHLSRAVCPGAYVLRYFADWSARFDVNLCVSVTCCGPKHCSRAEHVLHLNWLGAEKPSRLIVSNGPETPIWRYSMRYTDVCYMCDTKAGSQAAGNLRLFK